MYARPKRTDSESDILEMQRKFLAEKEKNAEFQPAAQVVSLARPKQQSLFAKSRLKPKEGNNSTELKSAEISRIVLGDVVEREVLRPSETSSVSNDEQLSFPKVEKIGVLKASPSSGKSMFALSMERKRLNAAVEPMETEPVPKQARETFGCSSVVVEGAQSAKSIHEENIQILSQMKQEEILAERAKLLQSIDPKLVEFLAEKRRQKQIKNNTPPKAVSKPEPLPPLEVSAAAEILSSKSAEKWMHFDVVEKEKLEWMKDIPETISKLKPGEPFEARFDWKGVLLPYSEDNSTVDDRELYLHGDEPNRPGYTLQELFRLARSNVMQQRISAFNAISGILNIYNQGFYDNVLELPISKLFFLLRFGLDENATATLEVVSKGLAMMFYNDTDETTLDLITETNEGYLQPILECEESPSAPGNATDSVEDQLQKLKLSSTPFQAKVQEEEDEQSRTSMTDFQLAETDLVECLLRTNIVQRICYILSTIKPENSTVLSCIKILIRIARTNKSSAQQILSHEELMKTLLNYFLTALDGNVQNNKEQQFYNFPQFLVLKLFRVIMAQHLSLALKLTALGVVERLKGYLFTKDDLKPKLIKVQIEALRIVRVVMLLQRDQALFRSLLPAFRSMLEWHYQHVIFEEGGPFLIRQHASALLNAISSGAVTSDVRAALSEQLAMCSSKWFYEATNKGVKEFSQSTLLAACLNCVAVFTKLTPDSKFDDFKRKYLTEFLKSPSFVNTAKALSCSSIVLKESSDRSAVNASIPNLGSVLIYKSSPQLIVSQTYPVFLLSSVFKLIEQQVQSNDNLLMHSLIQPDTVEGFVEFVQKLSKGINKKLALNFVAKTEIRLICKLLRFSGFREFLTKDVIMQAAFNVLCCMTPEQINEIDVLFEQVIFQEANLEAEKAVLDSWRQIYLESLVYPHRIVISPTDIALCIFATQRPILPADWPYLLLKSLLNKYLNFAQKSHMDGDADFPEHEIIKITLTFTNLLESSNLQITTPTEKLMYLMIAFMGPDSQFLEPEMKCLLSAHIQKFYQQCAECSFDFDGIFEGKSKFENLFVLFLDHFQGASYGDALFGSLLMIPLAQKYDAKWRKMVWSEHASVLRFVNCNEDQLLGSLDSYLHPVETDESLVKCYARALSGNLLRPGSVPHKIAVHHVKSYKKESLSK